MPKKIKYEYHEPCEAALSERIEMRKVKDAIDMYNQMKEQGKPFILLLKMENYQRKKLYYFLKWKITPPPPNYIVSENGKLPQKLYCFLKWKLSPLTPNFFYIASKNGKL